MPPPVASVAGRRPDPGQRLGERVSLIGRLRVDFHVRPHDRVADGDGGGLEVVERPDLELGLRLTLQEAAAAGALDPGVGLHRELISFDVLAADIHPRGGAGEGARTGVVGLGLDGAEVDACV